MTSPLHSHKQKAEDVHVLNSAEHCWAALGDSSEYCQGLSGKNGRASLPLRNICHFELEGEEFKL